MTKREPVWQSGYGGRHAELYDAFYADKPYAAEAERVVALVARYAGAKPVRLLDVACGTGRHLEAFLALGVAQVVGVDLSSAMVAAAKRRVGDRCQVEEGDMTALGRVPAAAAGGFDAVVCLFDSLGHLAQLDAIDVALQQLGRALRPGGVLILELWHAAPMVAQHDPLRVRRVRQGDRETLRVAETLVDAAARVAEVRYTFYDLYDDQRWDAVREKHVCRFFDVSEVRMLLEKAGLECCAVHDGYMERPPTDGAWHLLVAGRRPQVPGAS